jgi:hypothetical protein
MQVAYAQHPHPDHSDDRIIVTDNAVVILDGATAFVPVPVTAQTYADRLGRCLAKLLTDSPGDSLPSVLASAIEVTATELGLRPGHSPSATVSVIRESPDGVDLLMLGDNTIVVGTEPPITLSDDRLDQLELSESRQYRERLRAGGGYDEHHAEILRALQRRQIQARNQPGGYWIAESDPTAAHHALTQHYAPPGPIWFLAMTDGAAAHVSPDKASALATLGDAQLLALLEQWQRWETECDPDGRQMPRAKRSDDKAIAVIRRAP